MIKKWIIYKITNPHGKVYIGRSHNFKRRMNEYRLLHCKDQPKLYNSLKKYGFENHSIEVIDLFESDLKYAHGKEMFWIRTFMSHSSKFGRDGLNCNDGGRGGVVGIPRSEETIRKIKETKKKNPYIWSEEQKEAQSKRSKGRKYPNRKDDPDMIKRKIQKLAEINRGRKYNLGIKRSPEAIEKTASKLRGRKIRDNVRAALSIHREKTMRRVFQFDKSGNFISEHKSSAHAAKVFSCHPSAIRNVAIGRNRTYKGFIFKYDNTNPDPVTTRFKNRSKFNKSNKFSDDDFIDMINMRKKGSTLQEIANRYNTCNSNIHRIIKNRE